MREIRHLVLQKNLTHLKRKTTLQECLAEIDSECCIGFASGLSTIYIMFYKGYVVYCYVTQVKFHPKYVIFGVFTPVFMIDFPRFIGGFLA